MDIRGYTRTEMKEASKKILVTVPEPLLKKLDRVATQQRRSRSAEMCLRLADSLKPAKQLKGGVTA